MSHLAARRAYRPCHGGRAAPAALLVALALAALQPPQAAAAPPTSKDMTFFLHYVNETETAQSLPGAGSTWSYFDTTTAWNGTNVSFLANGSLQTFSWYLAPALAAPVAVSGYRLSIWAQFLSGMPSAQTTIDLAERSPTGAEAVVHTANLGSVGFSSSPALSEFTASLPSAHTFSAGSSVKLTVKVNPGAGSMVFIFDTARADSRVALRTADAVAVAAVDVLDSSGAAVVSLDPSANNTTARLRATVRDPFGGYDVAEAALSIWNASGARLVDNASMALAAGSPVSFESSFELAWNYSGLAPGTYRAQVSVADNNARNWFAHFGQFSYGPYGDWLARNFTIGEPPRFAWVRVEDDAGLPLAGAFAALVGAAGPAPFGATDAAGLVNLSAGPGTYTLTVVWTGVEVARTTLGLDTNISAASAVVVRAAVYTPTLRLVDSRGAPLERAEVSYTHPNGTTTLAPLLTGADGTVAFNRTAGGPYALHVRWRTEQVLNATWDVNASAVFTVQGRVFYVDLRLLDSRGVGVAFAAVVVRGGPSGVVLDYGVTNATGALVSRLPGTTVEVAAFLRDVQVALEGALAVAGDASVDIAASVFYAQVVVRDGQDLPVAGAQVTLRTANGTVAESLPTNASGAALMRVPAALYTMAIVWQGAPVYADNAFAVAADSSTTVRISIAAVSIRVVDSRGVALAGAAVALSSPSGEAVTAGATDASGSVSLHAPAANYTLEVAWGGAVVLSQSGFAVAGNASVTLEAAVAYLTVLAVDREGRPLRDVTVAIDPLDRANGTVLAYTGADGKALFRLPQGAYRITGRLIATYLLSPIDQTVLSSATLASADAEVTLTLTEFQPALVSTNAFAVAVLFLLAAVAMMGFIYLRYQRPHRAQDDADEEAEPPAAPPSP